MVSRIWQEVAHNIEMYAGSCPSCVGRGNRNLIDHHPRLLSEEAGRFVLIKNADVLGAFPNRSAALREGYRRFGVVPFLVRQIADPEPEVYLLNVVH